MTGKIILVFIMVAGLVGIILGGMSLLNFNLASLYSVLTATVTINPLEVEVAAPGEVEINKTFIVRVEVENKGSQRIEGVEGEIFLPEELETKKDEEQQIGILPPESKKTISWPVRGQETGNYVVLIRISGELGEKEISSEDSTMVQITGKSLPSRDSSRGFFQRFFDFLRNLSS